MGTQITTKLGNATPGHVSFLDGQGELPMIQVTTRWSVAQIYLQGAQVTDFRKSGEPPLLFTSQCSRFVKNQPIRGGIPVIFPWFGHREGLGQHGFARITEWVLREFAPTLDGSVSVRLQLPDSPQAATLPPFSADYTVTINQKLTLQLTVTNRSPDQPFTFENCLHSYFQVGDVNQVEVKGLKGARYLDKVEDFAPKTEANESVRISSEVDRIYLGTTGAIRILDPANKRRILVEKQGSASTVVWNPWTDKAHQMPDFGNEEYQRMICVESGNVASNRITLAPGEKSILTVALSSDPIDSLSN